MPSIGDSLELTPKDLRNFNKKMTDDILQAQKDGWRGHVNRQGYVSMLAPDGKDTVVISANSNAINQLMLGINRYRRRMGETVTVEEKPKEKVPQKWPCARPGCPKVYASAEQLNVHIQVDHEKRFKCPECNETFKAPNVVGRHRQLKHGYVSPYKAKRKEQEANRAKKKLNEEGKLTEEQREAVKEYVGDHPIFGEKNPKEEVDAVKLPSPEDIAAVMAGGLDEESARAILMGTEESTGRDGVKFDPSIPFRNLPTEPVMDSMPAEYVTRRNSEASLKRTQEVVDGVVKDVLEGKLPNGYPLVEEDAHGGVNLVKNPSVENNYRLAREPQSVTLDLEQIMDMDIRTVARVLSAAGMKLELKSTPIKED